MGQEKGFVQAIDQKFRAAVILLPAEEYPQSDARALRPGVFIALAEGVHIRLPGQVPAGAGVAPEKVVRDDDGVIALRHPCPGLLRAGCPAAGAALQRVQMILNQKFPRIFCQTCHGRASHFFGFHPLFGIYYNTFQYRPQYPVVKFR